MYRSPFNHPIARPALAILGGLVAIPAVAGKALPKDLAAYLQEQEAEVAGLTDAVTEHFLNTELRDGTPCDKLWSKNVKKVGGPANLMVQLGGKKCFRKPLQAHLRKLDKELTDSRDISSCTADYAPHSVPIPDGRRPSDPAKAHAWAHVPAAALRVAVEASEADAKAAWGKCAAAVNSARDEYMPLYAWFMNVGAVSQTPADSGYLERGEVHRSCDKKYRLDTDISKPVVKLGAEKKQDCHFGETPIDLVYQYQQAHSNLGTLDKRVEAVESAFTKSIAKQVESCPTAESEEYTNITNDGMAWEGKTINAAVKWSKAVLKHCKPLSEYPGDLPEPFHPMVTPHVDAIAAAGTLAADVEARLPALEEKKAEIYAAEAEAYEKMEALCEKLGDKAEALELNWKKCMSNADLTSTARQYSVTDEELYQSHMEKKAVSCAKSVGMASAITKFLQGCEEATCSEEYLYEIDPYEGDFGDLHVCDLLYPDKASSGW